MGRLVQEYRAILDSEKLSMEKNQDTRKAAPADELFAGACLWV